MDSTRERLLFEMMDNISHLRRYIASMHRTISPQFNLPEPQTEVMFIVSHHEGLGLKELSEIMHVTPSAATQFVEALVTAGLLVRENDPKDRRAVCLRLSEKGKRLFEEARKRRLEKIGEFLSPLSNEELATFCAFQKKILARRSADEAKG